MPFCLSVFVIFIAISIFGLRFYHLGNSITLYTGLVFGFLAFFLWFRELSEESKTRMVVLECLTQLFLMSLLILTISNLCSITKFDLNLNKSINPLLIICLICSGLIVFYTNKKRIEQQLGKKRMIDEQAESNRFDKFDKIFYRLSRLDISYGIASSFMDGNWSRGIFRILISPAVSIAKLAYILIRWMYKEGWSFSIPFLLIAIIFVSIKFLIPIIYSGSYMDEFFHILSGLQLFKDGHFAQLYQGEYYNRGTYVSFLVGLSIFIFGKTIIAAKMVPVVVGITNFFLLFNIAKKTLRNKKYILLIMTFYTIIPWFIFNHFYIRMYVFYEFFTLLLTLLFILTIENIGNIKKAITYILVTFLTFLIILFFSHDYGEYLVLLYSGFFVAYIYFFEIQKIPIQNILYKSFNKNILWKSILFLSMLILSFCYLEGFSTIVTLVYGTLVYSGSNDFKYDNLFFNSNYWFSILFLGSVIFLFVRKINVYTKLIIVASLVLFLLQLKFPLDFQLTRTIVFFLPLFYLVSVFSTSLIFATFRNSIIAVPILILLFLNVYTNYPTNFFQSPYIPTEVGYIDDNMYRDAAKYCDSSLIITAGYPGIATFFHVKPSYFLNIEIRQYPQSYELVGDNEYLEIYSRIPILTSYDDFVKIANSADKVCFIGGELSRHNIGAEIMDYVQKNMKEFPNHYSENLNGKPLFFTKS